MFLFKNYAASKLLVLSALETLGSMAPLLFLGLKRAELRQHNSLRININNVDKIMDFPVLCT